MPFARPSPYSGNAAPLAWLRVAATRITSVLHADKIVILNDGRVDDVGTHWELLDRSRIYQEIYHSQQEGAGL